MFLVHRPVRSCALCETTQTHCIMFPCTHDTMCWDCYRRAAAGDRVFCPVCSTQVDGVVDQFDAPGLAAWDTHIDAGEWARIQEAAVHSRALGDWDCYMHLESSHLFYYNRVTGEYTWEAPHIFNAEAAQAVKDAISDPYGENLGADFENTPWVPPSLERALASRAARVFAGGAGHLWSTGSDDIAGLGIGVLAYFALLRYLMAGTLVACILSLPPLLFYSAGGRVPGSAPNVMGLGSLTLGNAAWQAPDAPSMVVPLNASVPFGGGGASLTAAGAGLLIMLCDWAYSAFLAAFFVFMARRFGSIIRVAAARSVSAGDYTVRVRRLPPGASQAEVLAHFNKFAPTLVHVYGSGGSGASSRVAPAFDATSTYRSSGRYSETGGAGAGAGDGGVRRVTRVSHNGRTEFLGSWIADVQLAYAEGERIEEYLAVQQLARRCAFAAAGWCRDPCCLLCM